VIKSQIKNTGSRIIPTLIPRRIMKDINKSTAATRRTADLIIIPTRTENRTNPSLYSLFRGLKNVWRSKGTESRFAI